MIKAVSLGVKLKKVSDDTFNNEMTELNNLAKANDIEVIDTVTQELDEFNPSTYIGSGKVEELNRICKALEVECVIVNDELSPLQMANLSSGIDFTIYDRTFLILEIFKERAKTKEAIIQVELASISYIMPRLASMRDGFSRQGGRGKSKGAGESQLELDKRYNNDRIHALKVELKNLTNIRKVARDKRNSSEIKKVSLVGYTNSGKSTLMNTFLKRAKNYSKEKEVFNKDMLFATLETSSRKIEFSNSSIVLTDTVGFIEKLPVNLVEAFKSTLEEIKDSDLLVHVVDYNNKRFKEQIETTNSVLNMLGCKNIPMIYAFNKIDKNECLIGDYEDSIGISALNDINIEYLYQMILNKLYENYSDIDIFVPYDNQANFFKYKDILYITKYEMKENGIYVTLKANDYIKSILKEYKGC